MTTLNREQIEAWLTLEGWSPYISGVTLLVVSNSETEWLRYKDDIDDFWENQDVSTGYENDKLISWADIADSLLQDLYGAMENPT